MFPPMAYVSYLLFFMVLYLSVSSSFPIMHLGLYWGALLLLLNCRLSCDMFICTLTNVRWLWKVQSRFSSSG